MKIKHFIVTYNNSNRLNNSLESLFKSRCFLDLNHEIEIIIINNHSNININNKFINNITILNNQTRPDFSTGHLSRNWNQAIINGFGNLTNPNCDIVIASQDDTIFNTEYIQKTIEISKYFDFYSCGIGDQFMIFTTNGIKKIGLWDERFCNIGYQESDYFLRALKYHYNKVSINDYVHNRVYNEYNKLCPIVYTPSGYMTGDSEHIRSMQYHNYSLKVFINKWGLHPNDWITLSLESIRMINPQIMSFIFYPYFEKDIESLHEQKYLI